MPRPRKKKFWQTEKFKEIQAKWEKKLKESGFIDAEEGENSFYLKQYTSNVYRTKDTSLIEARQTYFELLCQHYSAERFNDIVAAIIMRMRCDGVETKEISRKLKAIGVRSSTETIRKIRRHYEKKWGILKTKKTQR
jgi:hypothetical protein